MEGIIPQHGGISHNTDITDATFSHAKSESVPRAFSYLFTRFTATVSRRRDRWTNDGERIRASEMWRTGGAGEMEEFPDRRFLYSPKHAARGARLSLSLSRLEREGAPVIAQGVDFIKLSSLSLPYVTEISGDTAGSRGEK